MRREWNEYLKSKQSGLGEYADIFNISFCRKLVENYINQQLRQKTITQGEANELLNLAQRDFGSTQQDLIQQTRLIDYNEECRGNSNEAQPS